MDPFSRDETFDYGLDPDETFEPLDDSDEPFDLTRPHILTALGPIDPDDLGVAVLITKCTDDRTRWDKNPAGTVGALEDAFNVGLRAVILTDPISDEQARSDLEWIAGRSPVHLVVPEVFGPSVDVVGVDLSGALLRDATETIQPDRTVLALDPEPRSWAESMERAPLALMERGLDAMTVRRILIDNPAAAFTTQRAATNHE